MLPGFRFLFTAILLSTSILVFGLGAAALLRAAHEEFASNSSWRAAPEASRPTLAMLRVEPAAAEARQSENTIAIVAPAEQSTKIAPAVQSEQAAAPPPPPGPEETAALKPEAPSLPETASPEIPVSENPAQNETAPPAGEPVAAETNGISGPVAADETNTASTGQALPADPNPVSSEQPSVQAAPVADSTATKIAALDTPAIIIETPPAKAASAKADQIAAKKRLQARRAAQRRRLARARQAQLARLLLQQQSDPFAQTTPSPPVVPPRPSPAVAAPRPSPLPVAQRKH